MTTTNAPDQITISKSELEYALRTALSTVPAIDSAGQDKIVEETFKAIRASELMEGHKKAVPSYAAALSNQQDAVPSADAVRGILPRGTRSSLEDIADGRTDDMKTGRRI